MSEAGCVIGIIMGSQSDWETMQHVAHTLDRLGIGYETRIVSAHRTPDRLYQYAKSAQGRGLKMIIAGAGGHARQVGGARGAGDDHLEAAALRTLGILVEPIRRAVGRDDAGLIPDAEPVERMRDVLHRLPIGLAAHDDADHATSLAHVAPLCGEEGTQPETDNHLPVIGLAVKR